MGEQAIQHHAEELGQSRAYEKNEAVGLFVAAVLAGLWVGLTVLVVGVGYQAYTKYGFWTAFFILAVPAGVLVGGGVVLVRGLHEQIDGLRSWREATTYYPPMPEVPQLESPWRPPIPHHSQEGTNYIDMNERPALPDGRQTGLSLNEPTVAAILREIVTKHDGMWSRERLTAIKIGGERVTRKLYETLTHQLCNVGFLQERSCGGFRVADDIELETYFPSLNLSRQAGRQAGRPERGGPLADPPPGRGYNLAERHRLARMEDLDHSVKCYLETKGGNND
jgi:hypothetical protein